MVAEELAQWVRACRARKRTWIQTSSTFRKEQTWLCMSVTPATWGEGCRQEEPWGLLTAGQAEKQVQGETCLQRIRQRMGEQAKAILWPPRRHTDMYIHKHTMVNTNYNKAPETHAYIPSPIYTLTVCRRVITKVTIVCVHISYLSVFQNKSHLVHRCLLVFRTCLEWSFEVFAPQLWCNRPSFLVWQVCVWVSAGWLYSDKQEVEREQLRVLQMISFSSIHT